MLHFKWQKLKPFNLFKAKPDLQSIQLIKSFNVLKRSFSNDKIKYILRNSKDYAADGAFSNQ